jgi:hypothetical protein
VRLSSPVIRVLVFVAMVMVAAVARLADATY